MRVLFFSVAIVLADQVSKLLVKGLSLPALGISWQGIPYGASRPIIGDFFRLTYIENPGMAFGIDVGGKLFFSLFSLAASIAIIAYLYTARKEPLGFRISLASSTVFCTATARCSTAAWWTFSMSTFSM